jgi:hypothetical protein
MSGFGSEVICNIFDGSIYVTGLTYYVPSSTNPISLKFVGIINPNAVTNGHTGKFKIGIIKTGDSFYTDLESQVSAIETT